MVVVAKKNSVSNIGVDINNTEYIMNAINESKKVGGKTGIKEAYLEGLSLIDNMGKNGI